MPNNQIRRVVSKRAIDDSPWLLWNTFVDLLSMSDYEDLVGLQKVCHLAFWYDTEVNNGGHLQFFENRGLSQFPETVESLAAIGATCQKAIFEGAGSQFASKQRKRIQRVEDYIQIGLEGEFNEFDANYYKCEPTVHQLLTQVLVSHESEFILRI